MISLLLGLCPIRKKLPPKLPVCEPLLLLFCCCCCCCCWLTVIHLSWPSWRALFSPSSCPSVLDLVNGTSDRKSKLFTSFRLTEFASDGWSLLWVDRSTESTLPVRLQGSPLGNDFLVLMTRSMLWNDWHPVKRTYRWK